MLCDILNLSIKKVQCIHSNAKLPGLKQEPMNSSFVMKNVFSDSKSCLSGLNWSRSGKKC